MVEDAAMEEATGAAAGTDTGTGSGGATVTWRDRRAATPVPFLHNRSHASL
jgi:hypothetical protein